MKVRISNPSIGRARRRFAKRDRFRARLAELRCDADMLQTAAAGALRAYRGIFGRSCWNNHDRVAFNELKRVLRRVPA